MNKSFKYSMILHHFPFNGVNMLLKVSDQLYVSMSQSKIGSGKLMGPKGVSVDRNGNIIVVDNKSCSIFVFQPNGKLIRKFGTRGNGDKQLAGFYFFLIFSF